MEKTYEIYPKSERRRTCIHEAAHAIIYSLAGIPIDRIGVRPQNTVDWKWISRRGVCRVVNGIVESSAGHSAVFPVAYWSNDECSWNVDKNAYKNQVQQKSELFGSVKSRKKYLFEEKQRLCADVCGLLAGPIADDILDNVPVGKIQLSADCIDNYETNDLNTAEAYCTLISRSGRVARVIDDLTAQTETLLRTPEVWDQVIKLADNLEVKGILGETENIAGLPEPIVGWPVRKNY